MNRGILILCVAAVVLFAAMDSHAAERTGSYKGRRTEGKFWSKIKHEAGETTRQTGWQNERGEGQNVAQGTWDKENHQGTYTSTTTGANGRTVSSEGSLKRNGDGTMSQEGTITGAFGRKVNVERDRIKNEDGSTSVQSVFTGQKGKTFTTEKHIVNQDGTREVVGQYKTSAGKTGTFGSQSTVNDGKINTQRSLTNQRGKTWKQNIKLRKENNTLIRDVTNTNPNNESKNFTESINVDENKDAAETANK